MSIQEAEQAAARSRPAEATSSQPEASTTNATTLPVTVTEPLVNANDAQAPASAAVGDRGDVSDVPADQAERQGLLSGEDVEMGGEDEDEEDEEAAIARAIAMSLENQEEEKDKKGEQ
jgi:26S proteasome regulatory subunit N10